MATEIEAKFLDIDHDEIRAKLAAAGAELEAPLRLMRRQLFDYSDGRLHKANGGRLRVRDEGGKVTLTYKSGSDKEYSEEYETTVGSYEATVEILQAVGLQAFTSQQTKRETWQLDGVEIVLDIWPWLNPYIEIEGPTEASIRAVAQKLALNWGDALFGSADTAYRAQYPGMTAEDTVGQVTDLNFESPMPQWFIDRQ